MLKLLKRMRVREITMCLICAVFLGVIISFVLYVRLFTAPLTQIAQGMTNLQTESASASRIFELLESEELSDESHKQTEVQEVKGTVWGTACLYSSQ